MIITVGHTKGGTGKSTFAVNLAMTLARSQRVLLIDGDEQKSSLTFTQLRNENGLNDYTAVALTGTSLRFQTRKLAPAYDKEDQLYAITLRLDREFLDLIDAKAKELRITRSAWIKSVLSQAIDR